MAQFVTFGLPKGSLQEATLDLMKRAGFEFTVSSRSYFPTCDDPEVKAVMFRAQEIAKYTERGVMDVGLTGLDWILDSGADVVEVADLIYSKVTTQKARWVLAVPENSPIKEAKDLQGKRIATELVHVVEAYLQRHGVNAEVEYSWGATEVKVPDIVDAIVDLTETGSSLRAHKLRVVDTILETNTKLIANRAAWADPWKRKKIENMAMLLQGALEADGKVGLKLNVRNEVLKAVIAELPQGKMPTVSPLRDHEGNPIAWSAIEVILPQNTVRTLIPALKRAGAQDIIEYPLNKIIY
ncbi:MAG TPA: ATP phosphoribosyltransferase [Candidatus Latescibacteria bacterium]|nr:ATP phosphoribosyltransferase [Candidatus Latescibacterota bacterium]